jgi:predicted dehydrogenase
MDEILKDHLKMQKTLTSLLFFFLAIAAVSAQSGPLRIGVIGLTHTHVHGILGRPKDQLIEIVGIVEPDRELAQRYTALYGYSMDLVFPTIEAMIAQTKPEAVAAFGTIYEHLEVVEKCAPHHIHVMVEKPLAVSFAHAQKMKALAEKYHIQLLTNYETTWYPTVHKADELIRQDSIGQPVQIIIRDGHKGPKVLGISKEFLDWLIDPVQNGGGALTDFGCYGVNLSTWLQRGERPLSITAVTQQLQPENNPKVEDEATIILQYKQLKTTVQASWNWTVGRKDMEIYGKRGIIYADNRNNLRVRMSKGYDGFTETPYRLPERAAPYNDPFSFFAAVVRGAITLPPYDLSSLENNMLVVEILDAAKKSATKKKTIEWKP